MGGATDGASLRIRARHDRRCGSAPVVGLGSSGYALYSAYHPLIPAGWGENAPPPLVPQAGLGEKSPDWGKFLHKRGWGVHSWMVSAIKSSQHGLTAAQREVFDHLLAVGATRPLSAPALASELAATLQTGCASALERWPEGRLWFAKSQISSLLRCEGSIPAYAASRAESYSGAVAVGVVSHRAIQISHTHRHLTPAAAVDAAIEASRDDEKFSNWWDDQSAGLQSDLLCQMISRTVGFLDAFPPLPANWVPRFEESIQAKLGGLVLSARPDLVLGRPRPDMRQTMFLCDFKSGSLNDGHLFEARYYALVATLRFGVPPFRSTVFSLASGEWTEPDIDADMLRLTAETVVAAVNSYVDVMLERREPTYTPDRWCTWCPARNTCAARAAHEASESAAKSVPLASPKPSTAASRTTTTKPAAKKVAAKARNVYEIE